MGQGIARINFYKMGSLKRLSAVPILLLLSLQVWSTFSSPIDTSISSYCMDKTWPDLETVQSLDYFGSAVAVDKTNTSNIIILTRGSPLKQSLDGDSSIKQDVILIVNSETGKVLNRWGGSKFVKPHGIEVSVEGHLFVTDVTLHQVFMFHRDPETNLWIDEPHITLGERFLPGNDYYHFCGPADVAIMPISKHFYVADGYCNSRVVKFTQEGIYLSEFGAGSSEPGLSPVIPFNVTHAINIIMPYQIGKTKDQMTDYTNIMETPQSLIVVADRNNGRIQLFTEDGIFLYEIGYENFGGSKEMITSLGATSPSAGNPYGILFTMNGDLPFGQSKVFQIRLTNTSFSIINSFPISNEVSGSPQRKEVPHDIFVRPDGSEIYIIEAYKQLMVKKFKKNPSSTSTCSNGNNHAFKNYEVMMALLSFSLLHYISSME